ncbi:heme biosynthesis HemY N-terminal domain-containing protein [Hyphomicrobium sp.]|uniref:heme biosynthesis protein HemY n=1 Tax=Hyphomicrobium sp. TaxID=82 RepID=UPI002B6B6738|nr:heme biosynthesis HemY N-terminal domain-containing protein [Hyphomicrobium sp.]HRN89281.1 heme biosynthesis HemY N-terminal domain-containing protein [Hyphomicrobium sp.]HRQ25397.1 heme biosynthesis HemY N-terminal domain-containing protein [Hyphomicrobium sp.]
MTRLILFLVAVIVLATGLSWLADRPGTLLVTWQGYEIETSVFRAVVLFAAFIGLAFAVWSILTQIWSSPATLSHFLTRRRQRRGLDALSSGMIAIGAGDRSMATRYALQARKSLPHEPLTLLLRAQAAQLSDDKATARRIFEAMLAAPDTEQLGLRGLFLEAGREGEHEAQRQFAERALKLNPKLSWPVEELFTLQCKDGDWAGALETLALAKRHGHVERPVADRRRAVLLTAQAQALEEDQPEKALTLALEAHGLAPSLIPAAAIAGRLLAARGNTARVAKIINKTWVKAPHPELATAYAYARVGDSPRDRLDRVKTLFQLNPQSIESAIAVALAAIEAHDYDEARRILQPYTESGLTRRVAALLARIEAEENGDKGRAREWLARAVTAPREATWATVDGVTADRWLPVSPATGELDAFQWRVPPGDLEGGEDRILGADLTEFIASNEPETVIAKAAVVATEPVPEPPPAPPKPAAPEAKVAPQTLKAEAPASASALDNKQAEAPSRSERVRPFAPSRAPDDPGPVSDDEADPLGIRA